MYDVIKNPPRLDEGQSHAAQGCIRSGESTMDILGFQAAYDRLGLKED